jgi:hypothetical protein
MRHWFIAFVFLLALLPATVSADGLPEFDQYGVCFTGEDPRFDDALLWDVQAGYPTNAIAHGHFSWLMEHRGWTHQDMLNTVGKCAIVEVFLEIDDHGAEHHVIRLPQNEAYLSIVSADDAMSGPALGDNYCHLEGNQCDKGDRLQKGSRDANKKPE